MDYNDVADTPSESSKLALGHRKLRHIRISDRYKPHHVACSKYRCYSRRYYSSPDEYEEEDDDDPEETEM